MPERELEPLLGTSHFRVLIGRRELGFCEVGRLTSETDLTVPPEERRHSFETVVLRRALTRSTELYDWRRRIVGGADDRRRVTIQQLEASAGAVVNSWRLERAWPCRWSGPAFDARAMSPSSTPTKTMLCASWAIVEAIAPALTPKPRTTPIGPVGKCARRQRPRKIRPSSREARGS